MPKTVLQAHEHWIDPIKGSRFRGRVVPIADEAAGKAHLDAMRLAEPDATHHCWALRLQDGTVRSSDDGEPSGSAGKPIQARLEGQDWVGVLLVVSRWYGGTKLGVGGLIRAYGAAATAVLAEAAAVDWIPTATLRFVHAYGDAGVVDSLLAGLDVTSQWGVEVEREVTLPTADADALMAEIIERTAGRARPIS